MPRVVDYELGGVYVARRASPSALLEQAARAIEAFFRRGNLMALRESALGKRTERVEAQIQRYRELHGVAETWPVAERLMVVVSSGPTAAKLVRAAPDASPSGCGGRAEDGLSSTLSLSRNLLN